MVLPPPAPGTVPIEPRPDPTPVADRRPGELTSGWTVAFVLGWLGVIVALAAVWGVSRQLGLSLWWIGPRARPRPLPVTLAPFVPAVALIAAATARARHLARWGLVGALALAAVAVGDLDRVTGLAIVEFAIAGAAALVSAAAWSGTYRRPSAIRTTSDGAAPPVSR